MWYSTLKEQDVEKVVAQIPPSLEIAIRQWQGPNKPLLIGGGFIRDVIAGDSSHDIDLFTDRSSYWQSIIAGFYQTPIDLVLVPQPIMQTVMNMFDFTVCCAVIGWNDRWISKCHERFYEDLEAKRLYVDATGREQNQHYVRALRANKTSRLARLMQRGYRLDMENFIQVFAVPKARAVRSFEIAEPNERNIDATDRSDIPEVREDSRRFGTEPRRSGGGTRQFGFAPGR